MVLHPNVVIRLLQLEEIKEGLPGLPIGSAIGKPLLVPVAAGVDPYAVIIMIAHIGIVWRKLVFGQYGSQLFIVLIRS
ncbi:hypothetical protein D3C73_1537550 [compost metagenome]